MWLRGPRRTNLEARRIPYITTKNTLTALGILGAGTGGIIGAVDTKDTTASVVTTISGAAVAALTQVATTTFVDPVTTRDRYTNAFKYWSAAEDAVDAMPPKFGDAVDALRNCASDSPFPAKVPPAGVQIPANTPPA
jgi:hypothetical protein